MEDKRPVAQGLLKNITTFLFLATTAIMNDIMFNINKLSLIFQKSNLNFEYVQSSVKACISSLEEIKNGTGTHYMSFLDDVPKKESEKFEFQGHIILDGLKQRERFRNLMHNFLNCIIENITDRLGDLDKIEMFNIFIPSRMPHSSEELQHYGVKEIRCIFNLFSESPRKDFQFTETELLCEWGLFKHILMQRCKNMSFNELLLFLYTNDVSEQYPLITSVIEYCATIPMHTVDCERGFSCLNLIKTNIRNRLLINHVNNLLMINIEGPESAFNFQEAFVKWANMKERKIVNYKPKCFDK
nr:E3 SUMO-protein ligase KIAA1586-like [Parasteatoda tepidariorum]